MTIRRRLTRWATTAAGILSLGMLSAAPAAADTDPNIDVDRSGSITVHKLAEPDEPSGQVADGTTTGITGLTTLDGVTFTVERVTSVDLTTATGWQVADGLTAGDVLADQDTYPLSEVATGVTGTDGPGVVVLSDLDVGLYLVTETHTGPHDVEAHAAPFLVSVPLALDGGWLYDIHVYPKNAVIEAEPPAPDPSGPPAAAPSGDTGGERLPNLGAGGIAAAGLIGIGLIGAGSLALTTRRRRARVGG